MDVDLSKSQAERVNLRLQNKGSVLERTSHDHYFTSKVSFKQQEIPSLMNSQRSKNKVIIKANQEPIRNSEVVVQRKLNLTHDAHDTMRAT